MSHLYAFDGKKTLADGDRLFADIRANVVGHGYNHGQPLTGVAGGPYAVSTNRSRGRAVDFICRKEDDDSYAAIFANGFFYFPSHGLGPRETIVWLGHLALVGGDVPDDEQAVIEQKVGKVMAPQGESDDDWLFIRIETPVLIGVEP